MQPKRLESYYHVTQNELMSGLTDEIRQSSYCTAVNTDNTADAIAELNSNITGLREDIRSLSSNLSDLISILLAKI